jgi:hypothetical protein
MTPIKAGDEVRVFDYSRYHPSPEGGWAAVVVKVARKYATATYEVTDTDWNGKPRTSTRTVEFDISDGTERGGRSRWDLQVRTPAQAEQDKRRKLALAELREHGIEFRAGRERNFSLDQIEALAEVARTFTETEG